MAKPTAIAIAAHPDDIEFVMAGTLLLLKERGWEELDHPIPITLEPGRF